MRRAVLDMLGVIEGRIHCRIVELTYHWPGPLWEALAHWWEWHICVPFALWEERHSRQRERQ